MAAHGDETLAPVVAAFVPATPVAAASVRAFAQAGVMLNRPRRRGELIGDVHVVNTIFRVSFAAWPLPISADRCRPMTARPFLR